MSLTQKVRNSITLPHRAKIVMLKLSQHNMTTTELLNDLMIAPYELTSKEVFAALQELHNMGLLSLAKFTRNADRIGIDTKLTFARDWVFKIPV